MNSATAAALSPQLTIISSLWIQYLKHFPCVYNSYVTILCGCIVSLCVTCAGASHVHVGWYSNSELLQEFWILYISGGMGGHQGQPHHQYYMGFALHISLSSVAKILYHTGHNCSFLPPAGSVTGDDHKRPLPPRCQLTVSICQNNSYENCIHSSSVVSPCASTCVCIFHAEKL